MNNHLLTSAEQAHINAVRSHHPVVMDSTVSTRSDWQEKLPGVFPSLANLARNPWHEIVFTIALAMSGGALVGGVLMPVAYEVAQGEFNALPYAFWGVSLWLACAGWLRGRKWIPFTWFVFVLLIISSWV